MNGGECRFQHDVFDACCIGRTNGACRVDLDFDMQTVMTQQDAVRCCRIAAIATQLSRRLQRAGCAITQCDLQGATPHGVGFRIGMAALGEGAVAVEKVFRVGDNVIAAHWIIGTRALGSVGLWDHVSAI